jgi:hypothetical protein
MACQRANKGPSIVGKFMGTEIASADMLRGLTEIDRADVRSSFFSRFDETGIREDSLAEHHADIARIELSPHVPPDIVVQFETARNLYLYAWYVYRFYPVAEHQVLTCLELGLRERIGGSLPPKYLRRPSDVPTMRPLLRYAIDCGLIRNEAFRQWREYVQRRAENRYRDEQVAAMIEAGLESCELRYENAVPNEQDKDYDYLAVLKEVLPGIRNSLAHGSTNLSNQVLGTFELVQEILNQLYRPS